MEPRTPRMTPDATLTPRLVYALGPLTLAAFIPAIGCDPGDDASVEFRAEDAPFGISDLVLDPVPGSGGCEGCVTGFARSPNGASAEMTVRSDAKFVGSSLYASDDLTLNKPVLELSWQLLGGADAATSLCSGASCLALNLGPTLVGASHQLVCVMLARVVEVSTEEGTQSVVELTSSNGFAFTRHNACGMVSPRGYVAARLDNVAVQDWIDDIAVLQHARLCVPVQPPAATL